MNSHSHCWEQDTPACGIKKEHHSRCCLCEDKRPITNNNWEEELKNNWMGVSLMGFCDFGTGIIGTDKIADWFIVKFQDILTKKDQEHKAELEIIKGEIETVAEEISLDDRFGNHKETFQFVRSESLISILDSHINKL
jgi:hypothetical protein